MRNRSQLFVVPLNRWSPPMTAPLTLPKSVMAAFVLSVLLAASPAAAADFFWNNLGGGNWDDPANWTPDEPATGIPQAGDVAYLTVSYWSPILVFYNSPGDPALDGLYIDSNALLLQTDTPDGDLTTAFEIVGWDGRGIPQVGDIPPQGTHVQRGATTRVENQLVLGLETEGWGTYQLLETGALETGTTRVGQAGLGSFIQSGGSTTHQVENDLILGGLSTGIGTYELSGPLSVGGDSVIGFGGVGEFQQSFAAGLHTVGSDLILGRFGTGQGTYGLSTGELRVAGNAYIGWVGTGEFEQTASTSLHTVGSDLFLGYAETGEGTYRLNDGELRVAGDAFIGREGTGVFEQTADTSLHTIGSRLFVGAQFANSEGTYRLRGGELRVGSELGDSADPGVYVQEDVVVVAGTFEQSGGVHSIGNLARGESEAWLEIDEGRYELSDGELVVYGGTQIAPNGGGSFLQTGGTHRIGVSRFGVGDLLGTTPVAKGDLRIGNDAGSHGQYLMQEGDLTIDPTLFELAGSGGGIGIVGGEIRLGQRIIQGDVTGVGTGEFIQSGGSVGAYKLVVAEGSHYQLGGDGTLNLKKEVTIFDGLRDPSGGNARIIGLFSQQGGVHTARWVEVEETGTYDLQGGVLATNFSSRLDGPIDGINNKGLFSFSGGGIVMKRGVLGVGDEVIETGKGRFENLSGARLEVSGGGTRIMAGHLANGGTITLTDTDLVVGGSFSNYGSTGGDGAVLDLDPSSIRFEGDVSNGPGGYFVADAGSSFQMGADFINNSELNILWDTDEAGLIFDGEDAIAHVFALAGSDLGATVDGYLDNFAFGSLALAEDDSLVLVDGNATPGAALYVRVLEETFDLGDVISPFNIYYDVTRAENDWLGSGTYALNGGGSLQPIPEPGTAILVCLGLAGLGYRRRRV